MSDPISSKGFPLFGCALLLSLCGTAGAALADDLTIVSWGGGYSEAQRKAYYEPYRDETANNVLEDEWAGSNASIQVQVDTGIYKWSIITGGSDNMVAGCDEGILEIIDYGRLGLSEDDFIAGAAGECGVGTFVYSIVTAYETEVFGKDGPTSMADFWKVEKFPGKRGLYKRPQYNLEFALMADGVAPGEIYDLLKTEGGLNRAFNKLGEIVDYVVWYETGSAPMQLLADGEVVMTTGSNGRVYNAINIDKQPFAMVWTNQIYDIDYWIIPQGHPDLDAIYDFISYASTPERQGTASTYITFGPARIGADDHIAPELLKHLPTAPENLTSALQISAQFWADNKDELNRRFDAWLVK